MFGQSQWPPPRMNLPRPNVCQFLDPNHFPLRPLGCTPFNQLRYLQPPNIQPQHHFNRPGASSMKRIFNRINRKSRKKPIKKSHRSISSILNPSDPLNLQDLMKETERRRVAGLSPLRGDSKMNTPAVSLANESPIGTSSRLGNALTESIRLMEMNDSSESVGRSLPKQPAALSEKTLVGKIRRRYNNRKTIPKTGNYANYYSRRDPKERLQYLMPEWFNGKDVADYGCHNGTMTFAILEKFPDVNKIDALDCDGELIANARHMQRERIRWNPNSNHFEKINFQTANWVDTCSSTDDPLYDTILAFSVTKWIHLNHGDVGLMRFFRRAFNLLKPGGHLVLEPQPKTSYKRTRFTTTQMSNYRGLKIDPSNLEPLLLDLGFSYFDTIKMPLPNQPFKRHIMLCSKSYGATPASIRNDYRDEAAIGLPMSPAPTEASISSTSPVIIREPPPVNYCPQTPTYVLSPLSPEAQQVLLASREAVTSSRIPDEGPKVDSTSEIDSSPLVPFSPHRSSRSPLNRIQFVARNEAEASPRVVNPDYASPDTTTMLSGASPS
ncbi:hypothetical protein Ciccas_007385 [Cichlidogyrus casuarinus]|uniref:RNA methyltransferase n=1 Tax=Cichlidogyrus casuarinus TaxID=1844966 RepID=A0ABD2Q320_9PLAT